MIAAIRKEAFVQGWIRSRANSMGQELSDFDDAEILEWLPFADEAYAKYRAERTSTSGSEVSP